MTLSDLQGYFFCFSAGHRGTAAQQQLDFLASDSSLPALGPDVGFSLQYHLRRDSKLYFGGVGVEV